MESEPLVSIIIPTYNRVQQLPNAINSVLSQDYENFQIIIVDDGSTDGTRDSIKGQFSDNRIQYYRFEQNRGIGASRNAGVTYAQGEIIAFLDSDDIFLQGKISTQVRLLTKYPHIGLCFCNYFNIDLTSKKKALGFEQTDLGFQSLKVQELETNSWQIIDNLPTALFKRNIVGTSSIMAFNKAIINNVGNYRCDLSGPEDFEFVWRAAVNGLKFAYTTIPLVERYKTNTSITSNSLDFALRYLKALDACEKTANEAKQPEHLSLINTARQKTWVTLIRNYAIRGQQREALNAYRESLRFGSSVTGFSYLIAAFLGPKFIKSIKTLSNKWK